MAATTSSDSDADPEFDAPDDGLDANPDEPVCGATTTDGSSCQRPTENGEPCFMHGEDGPPADHGAPDGNQNGEENAGGGAPEGNENAAKHGFHRATKRRLEMFDDDQLAVFGDYYAEFLMKAETESAAARLATLAVIADELEADLIQNGVFRDVLDVGDDAESDERTAGRAPKTDTLDPLLRVLRELRLGKDAEGVTGNDQTDKARVKQHFTNMMGTAFPDSDELAWRDGEQGLVHLDAEQMGRDREPERSPFPGSGSDALPDDFDF